MKSNSKRRIVFVGYEQGGEAVLIKKLEKYFSKHVWYGNFVHVTAGVGIGILVTYPLVGGHPVRWGLTFLGIGILGHLWALMDK